MARNLKTLVVLTLAILANGAGNLSLSYGMKSVGPPEVWTLPGLPDVLGAALSSAPVIAGGLLLLVFFALFLSLLSWADLSYVLPMISSCFVVSALLGHLVLGERISLVRWAGIALVSVGVLLVALSRRDLSYVFPLTAASDIVTALAARYVLHERVTSTRWAGVVIVSIGVALISASCPPLCWKC